LRGSGEDFIAMRARQPLDACLGQDRLEEAARATVRVGDEDALEPVAARLRDATTNRAGDPAGPVVEVGRQTGHLETWDPGGDLQQLAGESTTPDHERTIGGRRSDVRPRHDVRRSGDE